MPKRLVARARECNAYRSNGKTDPDRKRHQESGLPSD
jgi:hypothetical protein